MDKQLNILIIGYGRMGKSIEALSMKRGHHIVGIIDRMEDWLSLDHIMQKADVAIEFTTPDAAPENIRRCFAHHLPVVCGTTGWYNSLKSITEECHSHKQTFFYAPNFSIGVNIFFEINKKLASTLSNIGAYKPRITETHHTGKLDAPSGTAIQLANDIIPHLKHLDGWTLEGQGSTNNLLPIKAVREDQVTGTHEVMYDSGIDAITLIHTAHNRSGFVEGALLAAEWVHDKQGVFTMKDLLNI